MTPEQREIATANAQRIVNAGGTDAIDYPVAVGFLSLIAQVEALTVPQGWKLVPEKATGGMHNAAALAGLCGTPPHIVDGRIEYALADASAVYAAMIDAAPTIPAIPGTKEEA